MLLTTVRRRIAGVISPELMNERNRIEADRRRLERLANVDPVTGLANRRALDLALETAESDPQTSIVLFDANNFGKLNKTAGHRFGDIVLRDMAETIYRTAALFGFGERVFRYGGDEFVILAPTSIAERVRDSVESAFGTRFPAVGGVSLVGTVGETLAIADATLQARKQRRKDGTNYGEV